MVPLCWVKLFFFSIAIQAQDWDLPHRPMTPSRKLEQQDGSSFMFNRSRAPGPAILNRSQPASKRGYLVKKGDFGVPFLSIVHLERFSIERHKTKNQSNHFSQSQRTPRILWTNQNCEVITTCSWHKARENECQRVAIGLWFDFFCTKK